ncbi:MAG: hypothetical protein RLZZ135_646, partial [Cyanobacteriota bacterium]
THVWTLFPYTTLFRSLKLYHSPELRSKYAQLSVERSALFSWEKTVDATLAMYTNILQSDVCN